jgi:hypothetical protein
MSFLQDYKIVSSDNQSPAIYHQWAAMNLLAGVTGRKVWVDQSKFQIYTNMYIFLVGAAGITKSFAKDMAQAMLSSFAKEIPMSSDSMTKQSLSQFMGEKDSPCKLAYMVPGDVEPRFYRHLNLFCDELINFLNAGEPTQMIPFLTEAYRAHEVGTKTKNQGHDIVTNPYINILGCLTTETMMSLKKANLIDTGFTRRCVFAYSRNPGPPVAILETSKAQKDAWVRCVDALGRIQKMAGPFKWEEIHGVYTAWYDENYYRTVNESSMVMQNWFRTKPEYLLKVAMLIALSEREELRLSKADFEAAREYLDPVDESLRLLFSSSGPNPMSQLSADVERKIKENPLITYKTLLVSFYSQLQAKQLDEILTDLEQMEKVICNRIGIAHKTYQHRESHEI